MSIKNYQMRLLVLMLLILSGSGLFTAERSFGVSDMGTAIIAGCNGVNGYWDFDVNTIENAVDVTENGNVLTLTDVSLTNSFSNSGLSFSAGTQSAVLDFDETATGQGLGFWVFLPPAADAAIAELEYEVQVTELIFNGTSFDNSIYPLNYTATLSAIGGNYLLEFPELSYSTSLPRGDEAQWVFFKLDVSVTTNVIGFTLNIYETDQWLNRTDYITIDNNGNANIINVDFQKWISATFAGNDTASWLLDELALTNYYACSKDVFVNSALANVNFNYTFNIRDQYGANISDSVLNIVEIEEYELDDGVLTISEPPMNLTLIPQAENYQFEQVNLTMPWNNDIYNLTALNGPPVNPVITSNTVTHINEVVLFEVSASDIETEAVQFQVDTGDGNVSEWFTGNSYNHNYTTLGDFDAKVRAKDETGNLSGWSSLHTVTVIDAFAGNIIVIDASNPIFTSSSIPAGTQVIIRPTEYPIELSGDLTLEDGAELMIDGGSLTMAKGSTLTLNGSSKLQTAGGAVLTLGNFVSDNLTAPEWWINENRNNIRLLDTQVYFYNFQTVSKSFTADNTYFRSLAEDATTSGAAGDSVTFSVKSIDSLILAGTTDFYIIAGDGCPSTTYVKGGDGGDATFMLYSYDEILADISGDFDVSGGDGEDGYNAGNLGISDSGNGGDATAHVVANNNCSINASDFLVEGGYAAYGVDDGDDERGSKAGKPGDTYFLTESWNGDVEIHGMYTNIECVYTRDGGSSGDSSGAAGTVGANATAILRAANNIVIDSVSLDLSAGDGGYGGDGDNAGSGATGGNTVFTLDCLGQLSITGSNLDIRSGDGGDGGRGQTIDSSAAGGGVGGSSGGMTASINCGQFLSENSTFHFDIGGGGDGGNPYNTDGSKGGDSGACTFTVNSDELNFTSVLFDISGNDAGDGSDGDDTDYRSGGIGGNGNAININWNILGNIELDNSVIDIESAAAGSTGDGDNTVNGASSSALSFNLVSTEGSLVSNNSRLKIEAENGADGGYAYDNSGGNGGAGGAAAFNCDIFGSIDITGAYDDTGSLIIESGAGGDGGTGKNGYGGTPQTGGHTQCSLAAGDYIHFDNTFVNVIGGEGGNGEDGEDDSRDSNGAKGGEGTLTISSPDITMTQSRVIATGGRGGNGEDRSAGAGGDGVINVIGDTVVENSSLIATHGQPGQNDAYAWGGQGSGNVNATGLFDVVGSIVGKKITGSTDINLTTTNFFPFSNIATSRGAAWVSGYPWNFLTLESVAPGYTAHTYKLVFNLANVAWTLSIDGSVPEANATVHFNEHYDANGVKFTMGPQSYIPWSDGDTLTFSSKMPVVAVSSGTATVDQPIRVVPVLADFSLYEGALDLLTFASAGTVKKQMSYKTSPYYISTSGWTVDSSGATTDLGPDDDSYKIIAGDYVSDFFSYLDGQSYIIAFMKNDSDGDGISDETENSLCTDPNDADSDDDGIIDGDEDVNQNDIIDASETDPCDRDTDRDGIQDGTEKSVTIGHTDTDLGVFQPDMDDTTTTDPTVADTDGDGINDGDEDVNHNGQVDVGEFDPQNSQPTASITNPANDTSIDEGETFEFLATVTGGDLPLAFLWNFDGGAQNSTLLSPGDVSFNVPGTYNITLTITDNDGDTSVQSITVTVFEVNTYYQDADNDGFGNNDVSQEARYQPEGYVTDNTDCNDENSDEFPGQIWFREVNDTGLGEVFLPIISCSQPEGYVLSHNASNYLSDCIQILQTCAGSTLSMQLGLELPDIGNDSRIGLPEALYLINRISSLDVDSDEDGYKVTQGDCNNEDSTIHPNAEEICGDGVDQDCDGSDSLCSLD